MMDYKVLPRYCFIIIIKIQLLTSISGDIHKSLRSYMEME